MPVYEYRCSECSEIFEIFTRSAANQGPATCTKCGSQQVQKNISLFGVGGTTTQASAAACGPGPV